MNTCAHCDNPSEILVTIKRYAGYGDHYNERDVCPTCLFVESKMVVKSELRID